MPSFYRTYRPKSLSDMMGQELVTTILKNTAISQKPGHAYLFYGPRGTGKTTTARIFAKLLNCEKRKTNQEFAQKGEPCNACSACTQIDQGNALDIIEIDAASNRGIDEIRNLKETAKTFPSSLSYKVFIIDEVHMLTTQAFNALLKTLEEPPSYVVFILATTEYEKLPATILSRTQRIKFTRLTLPQIAAKLEKIAVAEQIQYEREALELIAYLADGSMRDAESLFDQIASMQEETVRAASVEKLLGKTDFLKITKMADLLITQDKQGSLSYLHELHREGLNLFEFTKDLTEYLRRCLSLKLDPQLKELFEQDLAQSQLTSITAHAAKLEEQKIIKLLKSLIDAYMNMRYNPFPIIPLEVAIIENLS